MPRYIFYWAAAIIAFLAPAQQCLATPPFNGRWKSVAAEPFLQDTFASRIIFFGKKDWSVAFTLFGDRGMRVPLFSFGAQGTYTVGSPSSSVKGAYEILFEFNKKTLTVLTGDEEIVKRLGFDGCGLVPGQAKDISTTGCSFLPSIAEAGKEYDIVLVDEEHLFLGRRPPDGNLGTPDRRPTSLAPPLRRYDERYESAKVANPEAKVYSLTTLSVKDKAKFDEYLTGYAATAQKYGGLTVFEGTAADARPGASAATFLIIQKWPGADDFKKWRDSAEHRPWQDLRSAAGEASFILYRSIE